VSLPARELLPIDRLAEVATPYTLAVNLPYVVAVAAVAAEVAWLARAGGPARRRLLMSAVTATAMAAGALVVSVPYTAAFRVLWGALATFRWEGGADLWRAHPLLGAAVAFVAWDFSGWIYHLVGHRTRVGWAAHQPHHSGTEFNASLGLRQSWAPFHGLVHHPLLAFLGFDLRVIFVCAALSNLWQVLEHTSLGIRFPRWFAAVVMTPAAHRHHHGREGAAVNLGPFFTIWDRLAGTWVPPDRPAPAAYGPEGPVVGNPIVIQLAGWRQLVTPVRCPSPGAQATPRSTPLTVLTDLTDQGTGSPVAGQSGFSHTKSSPTSAGRAVTPQAGQMGARPSSS